MPAVKVGSNIYVEGTGNTLATILTDINDVTYFRSIGANDYEMVGNRHLRVRPDGELTIGNPADYSFFERLNLSATSNGNARFYVDHGGEFYQYGNTEIEWVLGIRRGDGFMMGKVYIRGDETYQPLWNNVGFVNWNWNTTTPANYASDVWDIDRLRVATRGAVGFDHFRFENLWDMPQHSFKNLVWSNNLSPPDRLLRVQLENIPQISRQIFFEDCQFSPALRIGTLNIGQFKNCTFQGPYTTEGAFIVNNYAFNYYKNSQLFAASTFETAIGQSFAIFDGCTFDQVVDAIFPQMSVAMLKDCTFTNGTTDISTNFGGLVLVWTGNTFGSDIERVAGNWGGIFYVYALDLTVEDDNGDPVEGAAVTITQSDSKEEWQLVTDSSGKPRTDPRMAGKILLVHKEWISGDPVSGTFELWSDASNNTNHAIQAAKDGVGVAADTVVMSEDRSLTLTLTGVTPPPPETPIPPRLISGRSGLGA